MSSSIISSAKFLASSSAGISASFSVLGQLLGSRLVSLGEILRRSACFFACARYHRALKLAKKLALGKKVAEKLHKKIAEEIAKKPG